MSRNHGAGDGGLEGDVDFDFFDTEVEPNTPKKHQYSSKKKSDKAHSPTGSPSHGSRDRVKNGRPKSAAHQRRDDYSDESDTDNSGRKIIKATVPTAHASDSSTESDTLTESDSDSEQDSPKHRQRGASRPQATSKADRGLSSNVNAWSEETTKARDSPKTKSGNRPRTAHGKNRRGDAVTPEIKGYSDSASDSSYTSTDTESDVTDVSPLGSPRMESPHYNDLSERARSCKPPKSPMHRDPHSSRSRPKSATSTESTSRLLNPNSDKMDLNLLMQAIMEMEGTGRQKPRKQFVVPPPPQGTHQQRKGPRKNFSFSNDKVTDIDKENQRLMQEILRHAVEAKRKKERQAKAKLQAKQHAAQNRMTTAGVNRKKEQERIDRENMAMLRRLQAAKPTKAVAKDTLLKDYSKKTLFGVNVASAHPAPTMTRRETRSPYDHEPGMSKRTRSVTSLRSDSASVISVSSHRSTSTVASHASTVRSKTGARKSRPHSASSTASGHHKASKVHFKSARASWEPGW